MAVALLLLLTACGSSGFKSAAEVAAAAGCDSPEAIKVSDLEFFVTNAVDCGPVNGNSVTINWFKNRRAFDSYRTVGESFGGAGVAFGTNWAVECSEDQADCDAVVAAVNR